MGMKFTEYCRKLVTSDPFTEVTDSTDIPDEYVSPTDVLISSMKNKADIFDKINIAYIEAVFNEMTEDKLMNKLDMRFDEGEIPDGIINKLSEGIFKCKPIELTDDQRAIIKVLTIYICIQN